MDGERSSTRLRKAFRFSNETDDPLEAEIMDEQEQEQLIQELRQHNDKSNAFWLRCLLVLTGLCSIAFLVLLIQASSHQVKLVCLLAVTSTAMTAYVLLFIPTGDPKLVVLPQQDLSPGQRFVPYMNGILATLIGLSGLNWGHRTGAPDGFLLASWMPLVMFAAVIVARRLLVEVNPDELWDLRYELKGA